MVAMLYCLGNGNEEENTLYMFSTGIFFSHIIIFDTHIVESMVAEPPDWYGWPTAKDLGMVGECLNKSDHC